MASPPVKELQARLSAFNAAVDDLRAARRSRLELDARNSMLREMESAAGMVKRIRGDGIDHWIRSAAGKNLGNWTFVLQSDVATIASLARHYADPACDTIDISDDEAVLARLQAEIAVRLRLLETLLTSSEGGAAQAAELVAPIPVPGRENEPRTSADWIQTTQIARQVSAAAPSVVLRGAGEGPLVAGNPKPRLTRAQYDVIQVLVSVGSDGIPGKELDRRSGHKARSILKRLAGKDADWAAAIHFPKGTTDRWRLA